MRITSGRAVTLPGLGAQWPATIKTRKLYTWKLVSNISIGGNPFPTTQATVQWNGLKWTPQVLYYTATVNGQSPGSYQSMAGSVGAPWMKPGYLATLSKNKVLDAESALGYQVKVGDIAGGYVTLYQIVQNGWYGYQYSLATGEIVAMASYTQEGLKTTSNTLTLISRQ
jgi:hypothetical protein